MPRDLIDDTDLDLDLDLDFDLIDDDDEPSTLTDAEVRDFWRVYYCGRRVSLDWLLGDDPNELPF